MKNTTKLIVAALGLWSLAACSKESEPIAPEPEPAGISLTFTATLGAPSTPTDTPDSRLGIGTRDDGTGLKFSWESTDQIDVYVGELESEKMGVFSIEKIAADGTATFTGKLPGRYIPTGTKLYAYYHNAEVPCIAPVDSSSLDHLRYDVFDTQSGKLEEMYKTGQNPRWLMYAEASYQSQDIKFQFNHLSAVFKLTYTFPDLAPGTSVTNIGLKALKGLYRHVAYDATKGYAPDSYFSGTSYFLRTKYTYFSLDANRQVTIYLRTVPGEVDGISAEATVGTVKYVSDDLGGLTLQAGRVYAKSNIEMKPDPDTATSFSGGTGTEDDPYLIADAKELRLLAYYLSNTDATITAYYKKSYKLIDDIDLGDGTTEWVPIGTGLKYGYNKSFFAGNFDGDGHTISGTMKCAAGYNYGGLFGMIRGTTIQNVNLTYTVDGSAVSAGGSGCGALAGAVVGWAPITIINCSSSGDVTSAAVNVGGLVGGATSSKDTAPISIIACTNTGNITSTSTLKTNAVGGVSGFLYSFSSALGCVNTGRVGYSGTDDNTSVGGIVGNGYNCQSIQSCWSSAPALGGGYNNGTLAGRAKNMTHCFARSLSSINLVTGTPDASCGSFEGNKPTDSQIADMNEAWLTTDPEAAYHFNADGAVEAR